MQELPVPLTGSEVSSCLPVADEPVLGARIFSEQNKEALGTCLPLGQPSLPPARRVPSQAEVGSATERKGQQRQPGEL